MKLLQAAQEMLAMAGQPHSKCDWADDERCRAQRYGDGNVSEHETLREAEAGIKEARVQIDVRGGIAEIVHESTGVGIQLLDFDNDPDPDNVCPCGIEDHHSHEFRNGEEV